MSLTPSNMMPLGTKAPPFNLLNTVNGEKLSLESITFEKGLLVMFICNHCPYVIHLHEEIKKVSDEYKQKGIEFVAISSNDVENYPQDGPELMKTLIEDKNFSFPYLYDATQEVAKAYMAACTPDFYLFDKNLTCYYRGRMDDSTPGNGKPVTGQDLRSACDSLIKGMPLGEEQFPSMGCNIKWKAD